VNIDKISHSDQEIIMNWIPSNSSVLDLGCGEGALIAKLIEKKEIHAQGIEIDKQAIHRCVAAGLNVLQEDIDTGLSEYSNKSFDFVILNQTFQQVKKPNFVLKEALRVGNNVIVGFPNFCYIKDRFQIFFKGRVPVSSSLPYEWYDTPNLHFLSINDFLYFCKKMAINIKKAEYLAGKKRVKFFPNLFAEIGLFLVFQ
jgi:methionine biosynthesis protein MetW